MRVRVCTWELALLWSRRVRQEKFSLGMDGADLEAIRQLVLAGFPTTRTWWEEHRCVSLPPPQVWRETPTLTLTLSSGQTSP